MEIVETKDKNLLNRMPDTPDPAWRGLYTAGGVCAFIYIAAAVIAPVFMTRLPGYNFELQGLELLRFVSSHQSWWIAFQSLVLESSIFLIITFAALFVALKDVSRSKAAVGALVGIVSQVLFMAYLPVLLGVVHLSAQFAGAGAEQQRMLAVSADALIAQNNAFNPVYETIFSAGVFFISLAMIRGIFHRGVGVIGIIVLPVVILAMILFPVIGVGYLFWWAFPVVWLAAVGVKLCRLGSGC